MITSETTYTFAGDSFKIAFVNELLRQGKITAKEVSKLSSGDVNIQFMNGTVPALDVECITGARIVIRTDEDE